MRVRFLVSLSCLSILTLASGASAHVDLTYPPARSLGSANGQDLKSAPCGQGTNMRTAMVTALTPGQMVEIKIEEYIDHSGYYAVSFDDDGDDDFPYPRANSNDVDPETDDPMAAMPIGNQVLGYHFDEDMNCNSQPNQECTIQVKIPNVNCQNCTLQVVQFMYDKTGDPQGNDDEHYYQCADIKVEGALMPGGGSGGGGASGGGAGGSGGGTGGSGGAASGGTPTGGTPTGGMAGTTSGGVPVTAGTGSVTAGTGTPPAGGGTTDEGGCSVASGATTSGTLASLAAGLLLGLGWFGRRRQRAR
jgi:hypothetical protein